MLPATIFLSSRHLKSRFEKFIYQLTITRGNLFSTLGAIYRRQCTCRFEPDIMAIPMMPKNLQNNFFAICLETHDLASTLTY
jgi:hypothetical protein